MFSLALLRLWGRLDFGFSIVAVVWGLIVEFMGVSFTKVSMKADARDGSRNRGVEVLTVTRATLAFSDLFKDPRALFRSLICTLKPMVPIQ